MWNIKLLCVFHMQHLNSNFNKLKMNDLIHVKMLIVQKMWKNHSTIQV
jgi:hypothetical protein